MLLAALFWLLLFCTLFSYFLYPFIIFVVSKFYRHRKAEVFDDPPSDSETNTDEEGGGEVSSGIDEPFLSLIITAYNEEHRIREKLENTLEIDFPAERYEIIVASDCSEDDTDKIVKEYADKRVKLVRAQERLGKENAQRTAIDAAKGSIIVFSDVATSIPEDALQKLVVYFDDASVGAVSSEDRFVSQEGEVAGEGAYVKYEMWLRKLESSAAGLVGLSGSFFAARKSICEEWDIHSPSDFNTALNSARAELRAVTAPDVLGFYQDLKDPSKEYTRKIRTVIRGMTALSRHTDVLNPAKFGFFSFQVFAHKLMRWLVPWFLMALFVVSALIATHDIFYGLMFLGQLVFYGLAIAAHYSERIRSNHLIKIIYFFVQVNVALFDAACRFWAGKRMTTWKPSAR